MNTDDPILPAPTPPPFESGATPPSLPEAAPRRHRVLVAVSVVLGSLLVASGVTAGLVRIPYDTVAPGSAKVVNDVVTVRGHDTYKPAGQILYTTVSVRERVSLLEALVGWLDPSIDVIREKDLRGDIPPDKYRQLNVEAMSDSKTTAEVLALGRVGYTDLGVGAEVDSVSPGSPAAAVLEPKDVIVAVDDKPVKTTGDAVTAIRAHEPGDTLKLRVRRGEGGPLDVVATLARAEDGRALLGVRLSTKVQLPFDITIDSGNVVGPSAGLAYALELLDLLTAGELTGGRKVAATGELGPNGEIGAIGGVAQKVITVRRAGAKVFLVPKANEAEARAHAGSHLEVRGVSNFDEALEALGSIQGSNALALARPSPGA